MASVCSRVMNRALKSAVRSTLGHRKPQSSPIRWSPLSPVRSRRCPWELGSVESLMPLHTAVATARMTSCLSTTSRSCRSLSQELGLSVPR